MSIGEQDNDPLAHGTLLDEQDDMLGGPRPGDAVTDAFEPYPPQLKIGHDGLPVEVDPPWTPKQAAPIPLSPKTMCCLEQPDVMVPGRGRKVQDAKGIWVREKELGPLPKCEFYKRQRVHDAMTPDRPLLQRFCTHPSLRGINGASLVLDDAGIFNCELRSPTNPQDTLVLDEIDSRIIAKGEARVEFEKRTGKTKGYRMFRTPEDVAAGRHTLDEGDEMVVDDVSADPLGKDNLP